MLAEASIGPTGHDLEMTEVRSGRIKISETKDKRLPQRSSLAKITCIPVSETSPSLSFLRYQIDVVFYPSR